MRNILGLDRSKLNTDEHDLVSELTNNLSDHEWKGVIALYVHRGTAVLVTKTGLFNYVLDDTEGWAYVDVKDPRSISPEEEQLFADLRRKAVVSLEDYQHQTSERITKRLIKDWFIAEARLPKGRVQELRESVYSHFNG